MYAYLLNIGRLFIYASIMLIGHDILNRLEEGYYRPITLRKLYNIIFVGPYTNTSYIPTANFFDQLISWPAFAVFGSFGLLLYVIFKDST